MDYCVSSKPSYRQSLVTEYKAFIRPHLDYGDIIYNQTYNDPFHQKMESVLHNAALAITGALRGKLYQELGLESFCKRWWYRKLCYFFKIFKGQYLKKIAVVGYIFVIFLDLLLMRPNTLKYLSKFSWKLFYRALLQFHKFASNLRPARSTRSQMVFKIGVLKNFAISTGRQPCLSLQLLCFPLNIAKYLKTAFL